MYNLDNDYITINSCVWSRKKFVTINIPCVTINSLVWSRKNSYYK